jgi:hypothetical protein
MDIIPLSIIWTTGEQVNILVCSANQESSVRLFTVNKRAFVHGHVRAVNTLASHGLRN